MPLTTNRYVIIYLLSDLINVPMFSVMSTAWQLINSINVPNYCPSQSLNAMSHSDM